MNLKNKCSCTGVILGLRPANERRVLLCNDISHWLGTSLESAMLYDLFAINVLLWDNFHLIFPVSEPMHCNKPQHYLHLLNSPLFAHLGEKLLSISVDRNHKSLSFILSAETAPAISLLNWWGRLSLPIRHRKQIILFYVDSRCFTAVYPIKYVVFCMLIWFALF